MEAIFVVFAIFINFVNAHSFKEFEIVYNKSYEDKFELEHAKQSYDMNFAFITIINSKPEHKFKLGVNERADKPFERFQKESLGANFPSNSSDLGDKVTFFKSPNINVRLLQAGGVIGNYTPMTSPAAVNYTNYSLSVLNQMNCGSCWAFAALAVLGENCEKYVIENENSMFLSLQKVE
jgi:C1A family cysteine protease